MMPAYFKPLRRKIGVITLVLACVFAAGLVRSLITEDRIERGIWTVLSTQGKLYSMKRIDLAVNGMTIVAQQRWWTAPYWSIVIPLTLLSAWLLLSRPRLAKTKPDSLS